MIRKFFPLSLLVLQFAAPAQAEVKAGFIDGTYVMSAEACDKLKALAHGTTPSINTVPWSVTANGIAFWEGGCRFSAVKKTGLQTWSVTADCNEEVDDFAESYDFTRSAPGQFSVALTSADATAEDRVPLAYQKCDVK